VGVLAKLRPQPHWVTSQRVSSTAVPAILDPSEISRLIDERAMSWLQWLVGISCALVMFMDGYDIQVMALAVPSLSLQWSIEPSRFGVALSAAVLGIGLGGAFVAPWGDRIGRRPLLTIALLIAGLSTLATATSSTPTQFALWRLLTGVGIGAGIPNCNAWTSEYVPARIRGSLLVLMNAAIGIGAFSAGFIAIKLLNSWGWRGTFFIGGTVPLLIAAVLFLWAPESLKFLAARRPGDPRIAGILRRLAPDVALVGLQRQQPVESRSSAPSGFAQLLGPLYRRRTLILWGVVLANLFTLYVLISWLPTLLQRSGWSLGSAVGGAALIQAGGVIGGILLAFFLDRGKALPALLTAFLVAMACLVLFRVTPSGLAWVVLLLLLGGGVGGAQLALNALSTAYYPPAIKATGMSWVGVVGTLGSIVAPLAGGWAIEEGLPSVTILMVLALAPLVCAGGTLLMRREWQGA
jgi:MFS transporter, AAHS family, 4-hydroxybenzoate transporter